MQHAKSLRPTEPGSGVRLSLNRQQRVPVVPDGMGHVYIVETGVLMVEVLLQTGHRQILEILYPGDVFLSRDAPILPSTTLIAASAAAVQRLRAELVDAMTQADSEFGRSIASALALRSARRSLHLTSVSVLSGEERLADFLVETALFLSKPAGRGRSFELNLTRQDMADYLALNPDTLSRMFSRLKSSGLVSVTRGRAVVPDWDALCRTSPMAAPLTELRQRLSVTG